MSGQGIYKRTAWHKEINKLSHLGKPRKPHPIQCMCHPCRLHRGELNQVGKNNANYGKHFKHTKEAREKIGASHRGDKSVNWRGGITPKHKAIRCSMYTKLWREAVFTRDNFTCQKCDIRGGKLHAHHILFFSQYPEVRFAINNGTTLCNKCHKKEHSK